MGDTDAAQGLLGSLRTLPNAAEDVKQLEANLKTLAKVRPMLARAAGLLQQGKADHPAGASALDLYREVQKLDPQNAVAEQGIFQVQRAVLDRALAAVAQNKFAQADRALAEAQAIRPGSQQMHDVTKRVEDMRPGRFRAAADQRTLVLKLQARRGVYRPLCRSARKDSGDGGDSHGQFRDGGKVRHQRQHGCRTAAT
jgi:hypothetical protein